MINVLYHSDAFASSSRYGLSRVAWEMYESLLATQSDIKLVPVSSRCKMTPDQIDELIKEHGFIKPTWKHRNLVLAWTLAGYPPIERWAPDTDIVHTVEMDYPVATRKPWVVTVHDLLVEIGLQGLQFGEKGPQTLPAGVRQCGARH